MVWLVGPEQVPLLVSQGLEKVVEAFAEVVEAFVEVVEAFAVVEELLEAEAEAVSEQGLAFRVAQELEERRMPEAVALSHC